MQPLFLQIYFFLYILRDSFILFLIKLTYFLFNCMLHLLLFLSSTYFEYNNWQLWILDFSPIINAYICGCSRQCCFNIFKKSVFFAMHVIWSHYPFFFCLVYWEKFPWISWLPKRGEKEGERRKLKQRKNRKQQSKKLLHILSLFRMVLCWSMYCILPCVVRPFIIMF